MGFITHFLKNTTLSRVMGRLLGVFLCAVLMASPSAAMTTEITQLRVQRADDGIYLSADVRFELAPVVEDALLKGIPMFFVVEADLYRERWYWTDSRVASAARTLRLAYQPLTSRWRVNLASGLISSSAGLRATLNQNYDSLAEALSGIQRIAHWKIADASEVDPGAAHRLDFSFRLDLSQLPRPFQIGVSGQREWTISAQVKEPLRLQPVAPPLLPAAGTEGLGK